MSECPICGEPMRRERRTIEGLELDVESCPSCKDEWVDEDDYEKLWRAIRERSTKELKRKDYMTTIDCPICNEGMHREKREKEGVEFEVEVCSKCGEEFVDYKEHDKLYRAIAEKRKHEQH